MPTHITARLAWHNDGWDGSVCKAPEKNTYCVGCKSFPGDVIARDRDLEVEKRLAGRAGAQLEGYVPPCSYSYNAFGPNEAQSASNPPEFFYGGASRHELVVFLASIRGSIWGHSDPHAGRINVHIARAVGATSFGSWPVANRAHRRSNLGRCARGRSRGAITRLDVGMGYSGSMSDHFRTFLD